MPPAATNPPSAPVAAYTSARIAGKLGVTKQAVRKLIGRQTPCAMIPVKGQDTQAWTFAALPESLRTRIAAAQQQRGFKTPEAFLASAVEPWTPRTPFNELPAAAREDAAQWRDLLAPLLARQHTTPPAELLADGLAAAQRILGATISADTFRRRFDLAIERDNGFEQWQRLDLYVTPTAYHAAQSQAAIASAPVVNVPPSTLWPDLPDRLAELESKTDPTAEDRAHLFDAAFRQLDVLLDTNVCTLREPKLKRRLAEFLWLAVPALAKTEAALYCSFDRKLTAWRVGGKTVAAITDRRDASGPKAKQLCSGCRELVKGAAVSLDGDLAQAWRRLMLPPKLGGIRAEGKGLCDTCADLWHYDVRHNKSYLPRSVRASVGPEVEAVLIQRHGPKTAKLASPYVRRDWSDIGPADYFVADDQTPNHLLWEPLENGQFYVGRPECLMMLDERTDYPIGYEIRIGTVDENGKQTAAHYGSKEIRILVLHCNDRIGIPHVGYTFENGAWASRLIDGEPVQGWEFNPWKRVEHGLRDPRLGLKVRHADPGNPRTKPIERVFGMTQNRMRPQAGFVGFNERTDKREAVQDCLRRVRAGKEHPGNEFHSLAGFIKLLDEEMMAFAREPQNGQRLPGVSPLEAWQNGIGGKPGIASRPPRRLEASDRALLASHRRVVRVGGQGIRLPIGGVVRVFWGDSLIPYQHRELEVAMNLEEPDLLHCLPGDREFFSVREQVLPSKTATREQLAETSAARRRWMKAGKVAFDNLPHPLRTSITRDTTAAATREEGNFINAETAAHREDKKQSARQAARIERLANTLSLPVTVKPHLAQQQESALRRMAARRESIEQSKEVTP